jgi:hypothetical protein
MKADVEKRRAVRVKNRLISRIWPYLMIVPVLPAVVYGLLIVFVSAYPSGLSPSRTELMDFSENYAHFETLSEGRYASWNSGGSPGKPAPRR